MKKAGLAAVAALATVATFASLPAMAAPITTNPGNITGNGQSYAVFVFADAANQDQLTLSGFGGTIFDNKSTAVGSTVNLGNRTGNQVFTLTNVTTGISYTTATIDPGDNYYHATYSSNFSSFNVGALSSTANSALTALPSADSILFVGFEDVRFGDYDYNDLIFAFVTPRAVPEPASLMLVGAGLVGLGVARRKRMI